MIKKILLTLYKKIIFILIKKKIYEIDITSAVDEFGNSFGINGSHFFIKINKILNQNNSKLNDEIKKILDDYYNKNQILSFNDVIGRANNSNVIRNKYFCPWEARSPRSLKRFYGSYKIGPSNKKNYDKFINRLSLVNKFISQREFRNDTLDTLPRVIKIKYNNKTKFLVREGNHRFAVFSSLGYKKVSVIDDYQYFKYYNMIFPKRKYQSIQNIDYDDAVNWPYVKTSVVSLQEAKKFFKFKFKFND